MKKIVLLAFLFVCTLSLAQTTYAKEKETPSAAAQIKDVANSAVTTVGNAIDSTKVVVKEGVHLVDTSSNFKMVYNDVKSGIAGLATALKVTAEHVYIVLCKQQIVKAVSDLLLVIILLTLSYILYNQSRKTYKAHLIQCGYKDDGTGKGNYNIDLDDSAKGVTSVVIGAGCAVALLVGIIIFCNTYNEIITGFINPEYGAMKDIMGFVQTATGK